MSEKGFGWHYPPGCRTYEGGLTVELACPNHKCPEFNKMVAIDAYWELGAKFLNNEEDGYCEACDMALEDAYDVAKHDRYCVGFADDTDTSLIVIPDTDKCSLCKRGVTQ